MVRTDEIIAIIDRDTVQFSEGIQRLLKQKDKDLCNLAKGSYKSLVITFNQLYLSPLSSSTLKKRSKKYSSYENLL